MNFVCFWGFRCHSCCPSSFVIHAVEVDRGLEFRRVLSTLGAEAQAVFHHLRHRLQNEPHIDFAGLLGIQIQPYVVPILGVVE